MKKGYYVRPRAEKLEFDYTDTVTASNESVTNFHGDVGHGYGMGGGCDHVPGHGNPKTPHP